MDALYDVCFAGQLLDGQALASVRQNIQTLFKASPETLDKLFSGKTQVLKRGCDKATALKYKQAIERAGAKATIRAAASTTASPAPAAAAQPVPSTTAETQQPAPVLDLAPVGADVLRPEERSAPAPIALEIPDLNLAAPGANLGEGVESTGSTPDTSHLSMGEVGEDIPTLADTRPQLKPNIDNISLSPEGSDFSDCASHTSDAPELDLSSIELAAPGADVLEQQYKNKKETSAPYTSHLSLDQK